MAVKIRKNRLESSIGNSFLEAGFYKSVPFIEWNNIANFIENIENYDFNSLKPRQNIAFDTSPRAFAVNMVGDSMITLIGSPSIPEGARVVIDPERKPQHGKVVLALVKQNPVIRKYAVEGVENYLLPMNTKYPTIEVNDDCCIFGCAVQVIFDI